MSRHHNGCGGGTKTVVSRHRDGHAGGTKTVVSRHRDGRAGGTKTVVSRHRDGHAGGTKTVVSRHHNERGGGVCGLPWSACAATVRATMRRGLSLLLLLWTLLPLPPAAAESLRMPAAPHRIAFGSRCAKSPIPCNRIDYFTAPHKGENLSGFPLWIPFPFADQSQPPHPPFSRGQPLTPALSPLGEREHESLWTLWM